MPSGTAKLVQTNYDRSILAEDALSECCYCLTLGQVRAIMGMIDQWTWTTRWYSPSEAEITSPAVMNFAADLYRRLILSCGETQLIKRRVNPETGMMEISLDGGSTWGTDPEDPRVAGVELPPPVPGLSADKCQAAGAIISGYGNLISRLEAAKTESANDAEQAALIAAALTAIFGTPVGAAIVAIFGGVVSWLIDADAAAMAAAFTSTTYNQILCCLYCHIGDDGQFDDAGFAAMMTQVGTDVTDSYAKTATLGLFGGLTKLGLNNWAATRYGLGADCSGCDCGGCHLDDWQLYDGTHGENRTTGVDGGGDFIRVDATHTPGGGSAYFLIITTHPGALSGDGTKCCTIDHIVIEENGADTATFVSQCGGVLFGSLVNLGSTGETCFDWIQIQSNTLPFSARIYLGDPCTP